MKGEKKNMEKKIEYMKIKILRHDLMRPSRFIVYCGSYRIFNLS